MPYNSSRTKGRDSWRKALFKEMLKHLELSFPGGGKWEREKENPSQFWALTHEFCDRDKQKAGEGIDVVRTESTWVRRAQHLSHKSFPQGNELLLILAVSSLGIYKVLLGFLILIQSAGGNSMPSSLSWLNEKTG